MGPGQAQRAAVAMLSWRWCSRQEARGSHLGWIGKRYGQEGQCRSAHAQGVQRSTWAAGTVAAHLPWAETARGWRDPRERSARRQGGRRRAEQSSEQHGGHRWRKRPWVAPVVLAVHPMWTDQSRQLIIRLLEPI